MPALHDLEGVKLKACSATGINDTSSKAVNSSSICNAVALDSYVDGSGEHEESYGATWAFCVLAEFPDSSFDLVGGLWGRVECDMTALQYVGAELPSNIDAEVSAHVFALMWLSQTQESFPLVRECVFSMIVYLLLIIRGVKLCPRSCLSW